MAREFALVVNLAKYLFIETAKICEHLTKNIKRLFICQSNVFILTERSTNKLNKNVSVEVGLQRFKFLHYYLAIIHYSRIILVAFGIGIVAATSDFNVNATKEDIAAHFDEAATSTKWIPDLTGACVIEHLINQAILDSNHYNSTHFAVLKEDAGCEDIVKKIQDDFYRDIKATNCIVGFYQEDKLAEHYMAVDYVLRLAKIFMDEKQLSDKRDEFIKDVFTIMQKAKKACKE